MPNKEMPDSDYSLEVKAYNLIWVYTKEFHAKLKLSSEGIAERSQSQLQLRHVEKALDDINREIGKRLKPVWIKDVARNVGYILIGMFFNEIVTVYTLQLEPRSLYWALLVGGILLIVFGRER